MQHQGKSTNLFLGPKKLKTGALWALCLDVQLNNLTVAMETVPQSGYNTLFVAIL